MLVPFQLALPLEQLAAALLGLKSQLPRRCALARRQLMHKEVPQLHVDERGHHLLNLYTHRGVQHQR
jgi:hypothetical protein